MRRRHVLASAGGRSSWPRTRASTVADLRGNVDTRLRKLADGEVDAAVLAAAGLARLGLDPDARAPLGVDVMVPAPGQGCLAVQCRADDRASARRSAPLDHRASRSRSTPSAR